MFEIIIVLISLFAALLAMHRFRFRLSQFQSSNQNEFEVQKDPWKKSLVALLIFGFCGVLYWSEVQNVQFIPVSINKVWDVMVLFVCVGFVIHSLWSFTLRWVCTEKGFEIRRLFKKHSIPFEKIISVSKESDPTFRGVKSFPFSALKIRYKDSFGIPRSLRSTFRDQNFVSLLRCLQNKNLV